MIGLKRTLATLVCSLALTGTALAVDSDARMSSYFAIWADNARVTPAAVEWLYVHRNYEARR